MKKLVSTSIGLYLLFSITAFASDTYDMRVRTSDPTSVGVNFNDGHYFDCEDSQTFQECKAAHKAELDEHRQERIANYEDMVKNPPPPVEPTKEQLQADKASLQAQIADLDAKIAEKP